MIPRAARLAEERHVELRTTASPVVTSDRVWLSTLMYGAADADVAVVFGHGFTGSQHNRKVVAFVRHLADSGLAVYTADFRGHGASGGPVHAR